MVMGTFTYELPITLHPLVLGVMGMFLQITKGVCPAFPPASERRWQLAILQPMCVALTVVNNQKSCFMIWGLKTSLHWAVPTILLRTQNLWTSKKDASRRLGASGASKLVCLRASRNTEKGTQDIQTEKQLQGIYALIEKNTNPCPLRKCGRITGTRPKSALRGRRG